MLLNYIKLALRLLIRNPFFAFINVMGLSIGFVTFFALWPYSIAELKTDQYHKDFERIARIGTNWRWTDDGGENWGLMVFGISKSKLPPIIKEDYPEVESYVRMLGQGGFSLGGLVPHGNEIIITVNGTSNQKHIFKQKNVTYADSNFFEFFTIPLIYGDKHNVLNEPNFVVLSHSTALKYFGERNPQGELLTLNDSITLKVSGVYEDFPHNSHLSGDMVISNKGLLEVWNNAWLSFTRNYIKLAPGVSFKDFENKINAQTEKYFGENLRVMKSNQLDSFIQPLEEIAFSKSFAGDDFPKRSKAILTALITLAVVVLLMAWVNYVNLSFSRVTQRLKEFATRKANGAGTFDLVKQFLIESLIINAIGVGVALTILQIIRQAAAIYFNIHVRNLGSMATETIIIFTLIILCGILLTGLYPALVGMANNPQTLFQMHATPTNKKYLPSVLTTAQFTAAIALILWGVVVHQQLNHILNKDTGLNRDGIIIVESPTLKSTNYQQEMDMLENQFADVPQVSGVSSSWKMIGDFGPGGGALRKIGEEHSIGLDANAVSERFIPFFEIEILAGRNFITDDRKDVVLISRVTLTRLGFATPEDAIGAKLEINLDGMSEWEAVEIVGVINDYRIEPYFNADESNSQYAHGGEGRGILLSYKNKMSNALLPEKIALKIKATQLDQILPSLETAFKKIFPDDVFTWYFLDDYVNKVYVNESITRNQILLFTILAIIISCLGLVGMMANRINEKAKELGVRKILGAGGVHLGKILLHATLQQFTVAIFVGIPIAYYLGAQYLQKYSERITLSWWYFAIPITILLVIMIASISTMLWKAVRTNPVESLRSE